MPILTTVVSRVPEEPRSRAFLSILTVLAVSSSAWAQPINTELVVNGDAETGDTTGWVSTGIDAVPSTVANGGFGDWVFTAGLGPDSDQQLIQELKIGELAGAVDAGAINTSFSLFIQSRSAGGVSDTGSATLLFLDSSGGTLDSDSFTDPISPSSTWDLYGVDRLVPPLTRAVRIVLDADRNGGLSTDAYFDGVSLRLLGCGPADLAPPFGLLDLADVTAFASAFIAGDSLADLDGSGLLDLADITAFVTAFLAGCP